ncbi:hypothetical protein AA313_de0205914 [Arthrobotrys entomopaga]|nr:hypothetical protein AA313_de0205914 [Arthrobotrys entomopaga]
MAKASKPENYNVKLIEFPYPGKTLNPTSLIGLNFLSASTESSCSLILIVRRGRQKDFKHEIHSDCLGQFFKIEMSDNLKRQFSKASPSKPLKIINAASGEKEVMYTAPMCRNKPEVYGTKQVDRFTLIGLQLQGMDEMGWIWAEDMKRSFEEGMLKSSVFIAMEPIKSPQVPLTRAMVSDVEDENKNSQGDGFHNEDEDKDSQEDEFDTGFEAVFAKQEEMGVTKEQLKIWKDILKKHRKQTTPPPPGVGRPSTVKEESELDGGGSELDKEESGLGEEESELSEAESFEEIDILVDKSI